ncbi:MAG TPA: PFL family protein [bacterium]|nr:PFL family protein [Candidatus Omnitrophota bacterium]HOJ59990.1 PFL family protein [bacterium]HOL93819.1 PFL family protein [bacterium]HPO99779.1 PFL family protein [bacterium]
MRKIDDILNTVRMLEEGNLDVRTVTMGINIDECHNPDIAKSSLAVYKKIYSYAKDLVSLCDRLTTKYGLPIVNKRLAVSPASRLLEGHKPVAALPIARALDRAAADVNVDLIGGWTALVQRGMTGGEEILIRSLPEVLSQTQRLCSSINIGSTKAGINVDAVRLVSEMILQTAEATRARDGFGCAKLVIFTNIPENNPFMAGAFLGSGEESCVINVGVSGPGVVKRAVETLVKSHARVTLDEIAEVVKHTAFRVTRTGELIGREVAATLKVSFGVVDLSLAPTPKVGDSVGEIYQAMGIAKIGAPGTTAAVALLNDAVKKGGIFASSSVGGLSGAFIPVMEDHALAEAAANGWLTVEKLEAMTAVCSVGLDMIALPGDTSPATLSGLILDEAAIGVFNNKTTAVRVIPVPGKKAGDFVDFGGLFGSSRITQVACPDGSQAFVEHGGHIPAPINSLRN